MVERPVRRDGTTGHINWEGAAGFHVWAGKHWYNTQRLLSGCFSCRSFMAKRRNHCRTRTVTWHLRQRVSKANTVEAVLWSDGAPMLGWNVKHSHTSRNKHSHPEASRSGETSPQRARDRLWNIKSKPRAKTWPIRPWRRRGRAQSSRRKILKSWICYCCQSPALLEAPHEPHVFLCSYLVHVLVCRGVLNTITLIYMYIFHWTLLTVFCLWIKLKCNPLQSSSVSSRHRSPRPSVETQLKTFKDELCCSSTHFWILQLSFSCRVVKRWAQMFLIRAFVVQTPNLEFTALKKTTQSVCCTRFCLQMSKEVTKSKDVKNRNSRTNSLSSVSTHWRSHSLQNDQEARQHVCRAVQQKLPGLSGSVPGVRLCVGLFLTGLNETTVLICWAVTGSGVHWGPAFLSDHEIFSQCSQWTKSSMRFEASPCESCLV